MSGFEANPVAADVNGLSDDINEWAESKGFWESIDDADWLQSLANSIERENPHLPDAARLRDISSRIRTLVLASKIALMHSELSEALETLRDTGADNLDPNFVEELADCMIRIMDTGGHIHSPLGDTIIEKMKVNEDRPYKHGRVF